jgi:glycosyltransferase involved in cell wall biosynthesis
MNVLVLIGRFDVGGIQRQVMATATGLRDRGHEVGVLAIYPTGRFADELRAAGIDVQSLERKSRLDLRALAGGIRKVRAARPDVLYCYHVLPNLVGLVYHLFWRRAVLLWGIRATDLDKHGLVKRTQFRVSRYLARIPDAIIANSDAVRDFHVRAGYPPGSVTVVPNGIDTDRFAPDVEKRDALRRELGLEDHTVAIGVVAQLRGKKGHPQFLEAMSGVLAEEKDVVALMVGDGPAREGLEAAAEDLDVASAVRWLGYRSDVPQIYNALDLLCLPSTFGEGFPNVIGEALASGVPVVATDVGGSRQVVGPHGVIVEPGNPEALAAGILRVLRERASGALAWPVTEAAARMDAEFSTPALVRRTERIMQDLVEGRNAA